MVSLTVLPALDLPAREREFFTQNSKSWYATPGHCTLYNYFPAHQVALWHNQTGKPVAACFFSTDNQYSSGKRLVLAGPTTAPLHLLKDLLRHQKANLLLMPWIDTREQSIQLPRWKGVVLHSESEWITDLHDDMDSFLQSLGKTTRKHLLSYQRKLDAELQTEVIVREKSEITVQLVREFAALHRQRLDSSGKTFNWHEDVIERRAAIAAEIGLFCGRLHEGRLISGTLNFMHNHTPTLSLVAHDPAYDAYHCGLLSVLDTVRVLQTRGIKQYNLHFRHSPFKSRLGAKENRLSQIILFADLPTALRWFCLPSTRQGI